MTFQYNEHFLQWLQPQLPQPEYIYYPATTTKHKLDGRLAQVWRWFHGRMQTTAKQYKTITHADISSEVETMGWRVVDIPERKVAKGYNSPQIDPEYLAHQIAHRIGAEVPQLSDKTKISASYQYGREIRCYYMKPFNSIEYDSISSPPTVDYNSYTIEWKVIIFRLSNYPNDYPIYIAVAYDALNDTLFVDYKGGV